MQSFISAVKRYSGYAMVIEPAWVAFYNWVGDHPKTSAALILGLSVAVLVI